MAGPDKGAPSGASLSKIALLLIRRLGDPCPARCDVVFTFQYFEKHGEACCTRLFSVPSNVSLVVYLSDCAYPWGARLPSPGFVQLQLLVL